ncbi:heat-inducible transcriptional repressor HrcA [Lacrimispora sp. 210928-DFI.3.58]|uniref:heat-inducible transcriptional repressor HrcA n=1 Tax=Lacrimispora sp. 210928-DFI.3.58 TaxID=2883214 RepID=UPI001D08E0FA|nr:heat-inducible transcriptional repressor HrcA [Lacrimispora sp. 210928-DFI.3.58]MCB7320112.1 heat-inducible transcriptional repressor HrcA [Lacrimispora sp. 210928-DFI.3.58]
MSLDERLDDRKITILKAIIKTYLETGEPVGSRTISKYSELKLSSATIRNEMSDLEEMGYIIQPHTSAGRIPSDKGYRFYVDQIMEEKENEVTEFKEMMVQKVDKLELVLKKMAQVLASNTNYAAMISGPSYHKTKLKFIQLSKMEAGKLLVVVVTEGNIVKNTMIDIADELGDEELLNLNILLNSSLNGLTIEEINLGIISKLKGEAGIHSQVVELVLNEVAEAIRAGEEDLQIYTSGATNIFKYPELSEGGKASQLIGALEQKEMLQEFVSEITPDADGESGIQVYIGDETPVQSMKDCSVVTANYDLGGGLRGTVGIIGPKRMDYEKVLDTLRNLMNQLDVAFKKDER